MRYDWTAAVGLTAVILGAGCSSNEEYIAKLRDAMAQADISLREAVVLAEAEDPNAAAFKGALLVDGDPVFSVRTTENSARLKYHIDLAGSILSTRNDGTGGGLCPGAISLAEALAVAEVEAGGVAVAAVPDDDVSCALEIQVLTPDTLWEVKVGSTGAILESEESDEDGTDDD